MASPIEEKEKSSTEGVTGYHTGDALDRKVSLVSEAAREQGKVVNPLTRFSREELLADADRFAHDNGLSDEIDLIRRGALVAQNPADFEDMPELSKDEKEALNYEINHRWSHPFNLYFTIAVCSIGAATQGWDQTGSNGANLSFPQEFGIGAQAGEPNYERDEWLVGVVNSAPYIASALCGCWLSDPLNNIMGRRGTIFLTGIVLLVTPICSGLTQSWETLFVVRLILGLGMGAKGATVPVFASENSPAAIRGALVMGWQFWTAVGIFFGFIANIAVADTGAIAWRLQLGSAFIPAVPLCLGIFFCPESPRWLMKKGRHAQAFRSLVRLRHHRLQAARDLYYINALILEEQKLKQGANYFTRFVELFTIPRVRRATIASGTVMLAQQMCGINIIAFYSSTIFSNAGFTDRQALYASLGFGATNWIFCLPAFWTIDTFGRRALLLFTFPNMCWTLLVAGMGTLLPQGTGQLAMVATFVYLFAAFYSPGEGPVPFLLSSESFPLSHREQGMAWAVSTCLFWAAVLSISLPRMLGAFTPAGVFGFYAGLNLVAFVLIYFLVPETAQLTLEELDAVFSVPHHKFVAHASTETKYWAKRWLLWKRDIPRPAPLVARDAHTLAAISASAMPASGRGQAMVSNA